MREGRLKAPIVAMEEPTTIVWSAQIKALGMECTI